MTRKKNIVCIGEILWDALPEGLFLGGAPFNVACHLHALGEAVSFATRIGDDELGRQALRRVKNKGMPTEGVQTDAEHPTGIVNVTLDRRDHPRYEIVENVAWDYIALEADLQRRCEVADVLVFGSLAQRSSVTRTTIEKLRNNTSLNIFDVNLRPPFDDRDIVETSLEDADIVKLNDEELEKLSGWFGFEGSPPERMRALAGEFNCRSVCVTRGAHGAILLHEDGIDLHEGYPVEVKDAIGAGDAFLAGLISGMLAEKDRTDILNFANAVGAHVATKSGATADLDMKAIHALMRQSGGR